MSLAQVDPTKFFHYVSPSFGDVSQDPNDTEVLPIDTDNSEEAEEISLVNQVHILDALNEGEGALESEPANPLTLSLPELNDLKRQTRTRSVVQIDIIDRIAQVGRGDIMSSLKNKKQNMSKGIQENAQDEIEDVINTNFRKNADGTIEMINKHHLKRQKQVLGQLIRQFGSNIFSGKPVMGLSLPVTIFEPRSHLERYAYGLIYAPHFLGKAGQTTDTLEQFKLAITYFIASLHVLINPQKPFNPILGETFQGIIGGCPVYAEQISHHPPLAAIQMVGDTFTYDACTEATAALSANSVKSRKMGFSNVTFKNTKAGVHAQFPVGSMLGTAIGKRTFQFSEKFYIFDIENRYYTEVDFENPSKYSTMKKKGKMSKDSFSGCIWRINDKFAQKLKQDVEKNNELSIKFKEKEHAVAKLDTLEGAWLENLYIGNKNYWTFGNIWPYKLQYFDNPLPSDSNYRLDVLYLRSGDETKSQDHKKAMEEFQRNDKKLRDQVKNKKTR